MQRSAPAADAPAVPGGVFMVLPNEFRVNAESASDNPYMDTAAPADAERARAQAQGLVQLIEACGVPVTVFEGRPSQPDGVFPNNAFATAPGRFIVGRMFHPGRRPETARTDIWMHFLRDGAYDIFDLSGRDLVAELTGPLVIDRARRVGFCGMSNRVNPAGVEAMHEAFDLRMTFAFDLAAGEYHTNVVMAVLAARACVLHPGSFADAGVADAIAAVYPGRSLLLDEAEKNAFAGNCIALTEHDLFMSQAGADALRPSSRAALQAWGFQLHTTPLDEIEKAGGSLRCMLAEIF